IELHLQKEKERRFLDIYGAKSNDRFEQQADNYAQKSLISENQWTDLINCYLPLSDNRIIDFAHKYGINPAIILGRVCHEMNYYAVKSSINKSLQ
ncbi:MAG: addiction module antidote protein, HigA family, partial [Firmicutes bacterium]|nr:addiction module antidote protein, HigA family [Bacillota bacterium]